ncbi:MAG: hypothetical protein IJM98_11020 [Oscillospiraceae bacterium]|nr:hypothetical protein [Oscillospiraceae bacterium]
MIEINLFGIFLPFSGQVSKQEDNISQNTNNEKMALLCRKFEVCTWKNELFLFKIIFEHRVKKAHEHAGSQSFFKTVSLI